MKKINYRESLEYLFPKYAKEWNQELNNELLPSEVTCGSGKKVWWKCSEGHEWQAIISHRTKDGSGCPYCAGQRVMKGKNDLESQRADLLKEWDFSKNRILPNEVTSKTRKKVWWVCDLGHSYVAAISSRSIGTGCPYCGHKKVLAGFNDLAYKFPDIVQEWDYARNGELLPTEILYGSEKKVWWKCLYGHSWMASVNNRTSLKTKCPYCAGKRVIKGENDLESNHPELLKEWDWELNGSLLPSEVIKGSSKKVNWKCEKGHRWVATISHRTSKKGTGCPYCSGKAIKKGENDIVTLFPELLKEWDYTKNNKINPEYIAKSSMKKVWWVCSNGHSYKANIKDRTINGSGCPICSGRIPQVGVSDLLSQAPYLVLQWDYEKNKDALPENYSKGSGKKIWWRCSENHSWKATICGRAQGIKGCPYCAGKKVVIGKNDFESCHPELLKFWDYSKNDISPNEITQKSHKKTFWNCEKGHSWRAAPADIVEGRRCPYCAGKKPIKGVNDLESQKKYLVKEWNYKRNRNLVPSEVTCYSNKKVWWICEEGHEWRASICDRSRGTNCPICNKR